MAEEFELSPHGYRVLDLTTGDGHDFQTLAAQLRWRWIQLAPHEPRMPPHQYVDCHNLRPVELPVARMLLFIVAKHPESYRAYFRGYQKAIRYLEVGDGWRYWQGWIGCSSPHRQRLDAAEPPRRVDEGARPIPPEEWGAHPNWPQGSGYGEWKREDDRWVFYREGT